MELAKKRGTDPYTAAFDLLLQEENAVGMVDFYGTEEHVRRFMRRPEMNVCTDGLLCPGKPHPRLYGSFARVLGRYARKEGVLTLEEAVRKMTGKAAQVLSLKDRGLIREGMHADITVFDAATISTRVPSPTRFNSPTASPTSSSTARWPSITARTPARSTGRVIRRGR